jgi:hypothetical protein
MNIRNLKLSLLISALTLSTTAWPAPTPYQIALPKIEALLTEHQRGFDAKMVITLHPSPCTKT